MDRPRRPCGGREGKVDKPHISGTATKIADCSREEEALKESDQRYHNLFQAIDEGFCIIEVIFDENQKAIDYRFLEANAAFERQTGLVNAVGKRVRDLVPKQEEHWFEIYGRIALTGEPLRFENRAEQLGRWYDVFAFRCGEPENRQVGVLFRDIKSQRQAEEELRQSEERYRRLFEHMNEGFFLAEVIRDESGKPVDYRYLDANLAFEPLTGLKREETIGRTLRELLPGAEDYWIETYGQVALTGQPARIENFAAALGRYYESIAYSPSPGQFACLFTDITERKRVEEALAESEQRYRGIVETANEGVALHEPDGTISYVNKRMADMVGYSPEEMIGRRSVDFVRDEEREAIIRARERVKEQGSFSKEWEMRRKDGSILWTIANITPRRDGAGNFVGYLAMHTDITRRKRMEEELRRSHDELELRVQARTEELQKAYKQLLGETRQRERIEEQLIQSRKMEAIGTLAGGIAHDFNNMLAVILGNAELILDELLERDDNTAHHNLEQIIKASKRSRELVKQILMFSRKSDSHQKRPLKLTPLLKETVNLLRGSLPSSISIQLDISTDADTILADPSQIQQIMMNLASNAAYAMREEGGTLSFGLSQGIFDQGDPMLSNDMDPGLYVKLTVADTGPGIPREVRSRVFEPFFTTKKAGEGTGMGLATAYGIVRNHGGAISVESEPGKGAVFKVLFRCQEEKARNESDEHRLLPRGKERILVVDDEPLVLDMVAQTLRSLGYSVVTAESGTEGLKVFEQGDFDLVITDHVMPEMTGMRLAEELLRKRRHFPIILFTGYSETVSHKTAKQAGVAAFLMKPVVKRELAETVRHVLDSRSNA